LATIGYQSATLPGLIDRLKQAGVAVVIDVRAVAASRRPGFSKTMLAASLAEAGIDYAHLRALGTPKAGRDAARAGRTDEMAEPAALAALGEAIDIAARRPAALLCFEDRPCDCHRAIVADDIRAALRCEVVDL
jgi:uncharacterized protein (DUF488 family)